MPFFGVPIRNGVPIGLGSVAGFGISPFDPSQLFSAGEQGAWYDPSDLSTMFNDAAGTQPITSFTTNQPVGLLLDKSKGLVLGPELITPAANRDFSSDTGYWTKGAGVTISGGAANFSAATGYVLYKATAVIVSGYYEVTFTISNYSAGGIRFYVGSSPSFGTTVSTNGTYTQRIFTASAGELGFNAASAFTGSIDDVSIKLVAGNHATASGSARPVLSKRYNLLTRTEEFNDGVWVLSAGVTVTANTDIAPNGTLTADTITSTGNQIQQSTTVAQNTLYTESLYFKKTVGATYQPGLYLLFSGGTLVIYAVRLNTDTGVATAVSAGGFTAPTSFSVIDAGSYWQLFITGNSNNNTTEVLRMYPNLSAGASVGAGSQVIWGADLRRTIDANAFQPAYQRVVTATDYDGDGFLPYLEYSGAQAMATGSIDFTAGDKMSVFAGVTKLSNTLLGVITELSADCFFNNGSFCIFDKSGNSATDMLFRVKGTSVVQSLPLNLGAPRTLVATLQDSITPASFVVRLDTVQVANTTSTQGTGNFGNYPLYIGARTASILFFTGRMYSLLVRGAQSSDAQISATESWINQRTGAY